MHSIRLSDIPQLPYEDAPPGVTRQAVRAAHETAGGTSWGKWVGIEGWYPAGTVRDWLLSLRLSPWELATRPLPVEDEIRLQVWNIAPPSRAIGTTHIQGCGNRPWFYAGLMVAFLDDLRDGATETAMARRMAAITGKKCHHRRAEFAAGYRSTWDPRWREEGSRRR